MQIVKLNLIPGGVLPVCFASQNDTGRVIRFLLFEGENVFTLSGAESIALRLQKPDGSELVESVTNTGADYVDVVTTADTCDTAGASVGEIVITDGGDVIGSANFGLFVESDAFDGGDIVTQTASGPIATFETNIETAFASLTAEINPVQSGTGTPSPSNPRPISGFNALNVTRTGVNVWDETIEQGAYSNSGTKTSWAGAMRSVDKFSVKPNTNYYFKFSGTSGLYICWYDATETFIERILITGSGVKQTPSNAYYCAFCTNNDYGTTYGNDISINYPSSDTEYHAYNGQTATVNFGQTVYGGVADVTNGKVTITHKLVTYNGSENWQFINPSFYVATPIDCRVSQTPIANEYNGVAPTYYNVMTDGNIALSTVLDNLLVRNDSISSVADFKTALSNNPLTVLYELATQTEITTTPEYLTAIVGQNNVYSDTNGDTTVEYYIEV